MGGVGCQPRCSSLSSPRLDCWPSHPRSPAGTTSRTGSRWSGRRPRRGCCPGAVVVEPSPVRVPSTHLDTAASPPGRRPVPAAPNRPALGSPPVARCLPAGPELPPRPPRVAHPLVAAAQCRPLCTAGAGCSSALILLNIIELAGVVLVGPGFWIGFSVSFTVLLADLAYLRRRAVVTARRARALRRRQMWIAAQQAAVRREHDRRAAQREAIRHSAVTRSGATRSAAGRSGATRTGPGRDYTEHYTRRALPR